MMQRFPDWPQRLVEFVAQHADTPFEYGQNDCCQFAAHAVEALTGENPAHRWPEYANEIGAKRIIAKAGGLDKLVSLSMGEPLVPALAGRGDIVMAELEQGLSIGVCLGRDCIFAAPVGVTFRPRTAILMAWKV